MDFSTVPQEVLYQKRQIWVTPGSRQQAIHHTNIKVTDFSKNNAKFYGVTPTDTPLPPPTGGMTKNAANFYGSTPPVTGSNGNFIKNQSKFFGITPGQSAGQSRPVSNSTEFQINMQRFYMKTPNEELQMKKNTKAFYQDFGKSRSPLANAGRNFMNN